MKKLLLILLCVPLMFSCRENEKKRKSENKETSTKNSHIDMERCTSFFLKREEDIQTKRKDKTKYKADRNEWYSCLCEKLLVKYESFDNILESGKDGVPDKDKSILLECMEQFDMSPYKQNK